jgi:hypothetical protein
MYQNVCILRSMPKAKKTKSNFQILIHQMDQELYKTIVSLADNEKRSIGKQAEYMLRQQAERLEKEKK